MKTSNVCRWLLAAAAIVALPFMGQATDLLVSGSQTLAGGTYDNVTITGTGTLSLTGVLTTNGTLTIRAGGRLSPNCNNLIGPGNFVLEGNGSLDICSVDGLSRSGASGAVQMTGTRFFSTDANYIFSGTQGAQSTGIGMPTTVRSLQCFNTDGLNLTTDVTLGNDVSVQQLVRTSGSTINTNGRTIRLLSNATGTALITNSGSGGIIGRVTAERYISPNLNPGAGYRHYSSPVDGQTLSNLTTPGFAPVFNPAYDGAATPALVVPFPTVYAYDQSRVGNVGSVPSGFNQGWRSGQAGEAMTSGKGFTVNIGTASKVEFNGTSRNGTIVVTGLDRGANAAAGYHLIGNPYPAPLDWSSVVARGGNSNVSDAMYVFESSGQYSGTYRTFVNGVGGATPIIGMAQGFFVLSLGNGGQVTFTNPDRIQNFDPNDGGFRRPAAETRPVLSLQLRNASATLSDETTLYTQAGATAGFDARYDGLKMPNPSGLNLATQLGANSYSVNGLPALGPVAALLPLTVGVPAAGSYTLAVSALVNLPSGARAYLRDALTSTRTLLTATTSYAFTTTSTSANGRFLVELLPAAAPLATAAQALEAQVQLYPNPAVGSFQLLLPVAAKGGVATLTNTLGQTVLTHALNSAETAVDVRNLKAGAYTLHLTVAGTKVARRVVLE